MYNCNIVSLARSLEIELEEEVEDEDIEVVDEDVRTVSSQSLPLPLPPLLPCRLYPAYSRLATVPAMKAAFTSDPIVRKPFLLSEKLNK